MKNVPGWSALLVLLAVGAAGCGSDSPTAPSFARQAPTPASAVVQVPLDEEPSTIEGGGDTGDTNLEPVDARKGKKGKKPRRRPPVFVVTD